jgi:hypothetical protein
MRQRHQKQQNQSIILLERKVEAATRDVRGSSFFKRTLLDKTKITENNANMICDYVLAMKQESNISTSTCRNILITLVSFSKKTGLTDFDRIDRQAIKAYKPFQRWAVIINSSIRYFFLQCLRMCFERRQVLVCTSTCVFQIKQDIIMQQLKFFAYVFHTKCHCEEGGRHRYSGKSGEFKR